jgi:S1-C subfamily serine protease
LAGFPDYAPGQMPDIKEVKVTRRKIKSTLNYICIDSPIIKGHSGGPVFNSNNQVVGIAAIGPAAQYANETSNFAILPISILEQI